MKIKTKTVQGIIDQLDQLINAMKREVKQQKDLLQQVDPQYFKSARNLLQYQAFRTFELRNTQKELGNLGLTRLVKAEGHIMASVANTKLILQKLLDDPDAKKKKSGLSIKKGKRLLAKHTKEILGYRSKGRRVRIMVTQPTEAADNYQLVNDMVKMGMNCARINCAHDSPKVWARMITNIRRAAKAKGKNVKIAMDLAGPKIRTGQIVAGPKIRKFSPEKDVTGRIVSPAQVLIIPFIDEFSPPNSLFIPKDRYETLQPGDLFELEDTRDKKRKIKIIAKREQEILAYCYETSYIGTGSVLKCLNRDLPDLVIDEIPPIEQSIVLRMHDTLLVTKEDIIGTPASFSEDGKVLQLPRIACQLPQVFDYVEPGQPILFDDGKIEGKILEITDGIMHVKIIRAKENGSKLKAYKGINFPATSLRINGLTDKDKRDLEFISKNADIVNYSFVNSAKDVKEIYAEFKRLGVFNKLGLILKIETRAAYDNLTEILLNAMQAKYVGVMIARGDLAVETGWDRMAKVQQELLRLCLAAHVPVVWATQVLESLAKKGLPSRAEITDAAAALKTECVMLNKGPHINRAISLLHTMLSDLESFQEKQETLLPRKEKLLV